MGQAHSVKPRSRGGVMINKKDFVPAKTYAKLSTGEAVKILRKWQEWTQADLIKLKNFKTLHTLCLLVSVFWVCGEYTFLVPACPG